MLNHRAHGDIIIAIKDFYIRAYILSYTKRKEDQSHGADS